MLWKRRKKFQKLNFNLFKWIFRRGIVMKSFSNRKLNSIFSIMFVFFTLFFLSAKSLIAEKITNYDVTVQINKNGTLTVNEVIDYEFDDAAKHGIYRDIPLRSKKNGGGYLQILHKNEFDKEKWAFRRVFNEKF